jgi:hypothetical protein
MARQLSTVAFCANKYHHYLKKTKRCARVGYTILLARLVHIIISPSYCIQHSSPKNKTVARARDGDRNKKKSFPPVQVSSSLFSAKTKQISDFLHLQVSPEVQPFQPTTVAHLSFVRNQMDQKWFFAGPIMHSLPRKPMEEAAAAVVVEAAPRRVRGREPNKGSAAARKKVRWDTTSDPTPSPSRSPSPTAEVWMRRLST